MSNIILSRIEKRLKKVESKIVEIKDNYEEMDNNIEDIYDTVNSISNSGSSNGSSSGSSNGSSSGSSGSSTNDKCKLNSKTNCKSSSFDKTINKTIDKIINNCMTISNSGSSSRYNDTDTETIKEKTIQFYNRLIINQPQLTDESLLEHITYFVEQTDTSLDTILDNFTKIVDSRSGMATPKLFNIINSSLDMYYKKVALQKLQALETMSKTDSEYFKLSKWLDTLLEIPFNIYKTPSYLDTNIISNPGKYLEESKNYLNNVIYGQDKTKQHIIEILARMIQNPKTLGSVFAIYGEPGTGKTTLIKDGLSHIFGLPFIFISLGGTQDRSNLAGSNYVYEGSSCGKIIQSLKQSKCMNPIFYFDELDKTSVSDKGNDIINLLIHLTDYTQNSHFQDDYMDGISVDLSRATFIFSFNDKKKISPILLDRMEIIKFNSYSINEKIVIARDYLLPNVVKNVYNDKPINFSISDSNLRKIVEVGGGSGSGDGGSGSCNGNDRYRIVGCRSKIGCNYKLGKLMKKVNKQKYYKKFCKTRVNKNKLTNNKIISGGVRYIKKILERIVSRINLDMMMNLELNKYKKQKNIVISDKIISEVLGK